MSQVGRMEFAATPAQNRPEPALRDEGAVQEAESAEADLTPVLVRFPTAYTRAGGSYAD